MPLSLVGPGGEGKSFLLLVNDEVPRLPEKEPNDGFKQAMSVTVPAVVEGVVKQPQDVDVYRFDGKAGDKVRIEVQARRYGSPADPMITLYDAGGRVMASGETTPGSSDPTIRLTLPKNGPYLVSVIESLDQGGPTHVYRLAVRREP